MAKILLVEDDKDLASTIEDWLKLERHAVELAHTGTDGFDRVSDCQYDVIVLDWDLPGMSGLEICKKYRAAGGESPIIMLTGKSLISEKEVGLDSGADDYLTKPFNMRELSARIRSVLRRSGSVTDNILKARDIELDPQKFLVKKNGVDLQLLPREFALLEFFMRHPNEVFSGDALLQRVWASDSEATSDAIRTCLKRLRKKIDDGDEGSSLIQTIHGVGYRLKV